MKKMIQNTFVHAFILFFMLSLNSIAQETPRLELRLTQSLDDHNTVIIKAYPVNFTSAVSFVRYYANDVEIGSSTVAPYTIEWQNSLPGITLITAEAYAGPDGVFFSEDYRWDGFPTDGFQAEIANIIYDAPSSPIRQERYPDLSGGTAVLLKDKGDKIGVSFTAPSAGIYSFRVRLRSGYYTSTADNPTSYWPNGYAFTLNNERVFLGGVRNTLQKLTVLGGSYWSDMVSERFSFDSGEKISFNIESIASWGAIDFIELVRESYTIEAETAAQIVNEAGSRAIAPDYSSTRSNGATLRMWDKGDKIKIPFNVSPGYYELRAHVRTGYYTATSSNPRSYIPGGYSFELNGALIYFYNGQFDGTGYVQDKCYGGSYWGDLVTQIIYISEPANYLTINANLEWGGIDYISIIPSQDPNQPAARLSAPEIEDVNAVKASPNPFRESLKVEVPGTLNENVEVAVYTLDGTLKAKRSIKLDDDSSFDLQLDGIDIKSGIYLLNVKTSSYSKNLRLIKE